MRSLSRDEVCRTFGLSPATLDALIDGGHLLCHVRDGESRVPLEQLEGFFREGLIRVYRAEAAPVAEVAVEARVEAKPPAIEAEPEPEIMVPEVLAAEPVVEKPPEERAEDREARSTPRYIPRRQIDGIFADKRFSIVQLSMTGLRIRHDAELIPGMESKLTFALLSPPRSFVMRARVVWTSVARYESGDQTFYISGLRVTEHADRLGEAIEILNRTHDLQPDRRSAARLDSIDVDDLAGAASDENVTAVLRAVQHFAANPVDAGRYYSRARFALSDPNVRRDAPRRARDREEVLGIWEYLERQVPITQVAEVLANVRRKRPAL